MPLIVVGTEKNFAALRPRLFSGRISNAVAGDVADAIRAANPEVDLDRLQPGTILNVPEHEKVGVRGPLSVDESSRKAAGGASSSSLGGVLDDLRTRAAEQQRADAAERKRLTAALRAKELDEAARRDKSLAADLERARQGVEAENEQAKAQAAALDEASAEWRRELTALDELLGSLLPD